MDSSLNSTRLQKAKAEILSLLDVISDKVDLERKLGVDYVQLAPIDIHNERKTDELSKSEKTKELSKLEKQVEKCTECGLCKGRTNVVFGIGDPDADLMFVGEAPGYYEDVRGEPFVGRAGQLLTKIIESIGLKREEVYIANILKCRPPENRNPNAKEIVLCTPHLIKQIEIIRPKVICALGTFAAQTLLDTKEAIGKLRGKFFEYQGTKFLPTYHPAYLLRNPNDKKKVWSDIKKVRDYLKK